MAMKRTQGQENRAARVSRRGFLRRTSMAAAAGIGFPYIIPASALGADGNTAPSNRIVLGCIGTGGQGTGNLSNLLGFKEIQVVAVCDVDRAHRENAKRLVDERYGNTDCAGYNDFRELLARDDLTAVSLACPDHWHAIPAIQAARRGFDIFAEKPLSLTIAEGCAMVEAVQRYGVVWQTGSWQRSVSHFRQGCELVRNGRIGRVHKVEVGLPTGSAIGPQPAMPPPDGFDYDFWLGPAPEAPYTEQRCHWNFRWILDYSGGQLTDWAAHHCDIANWGMGTEYTGPVLVEGRGEYPRDGLWNAAVNYKFRAEYAKGASPVAPDGFTMWVSNAFPMGAKFYGEDGWVYVDRGGWETEPASLKESVIGPNELHLYNSRNHFGNFVECVQTRARTITPIEVAHRAISIAHLGNAAMQLERAVRWDPVAEQFVNDPEATRKRARSMRAPWHL